MAIEVPQNEEISEGGKNGGTKGVDSTICLGVVERNVDPYIARIDIKRRKRGSRKFRKGSVLPDENDNATASVCGIRRESARSGVGTIRTQSGDLGKRKMS